MVHSLRDSLVPYLEPCTLSWGSSGAVYLILGAKDSILAPETPSWDHVPHPGFKYPIFWPCITYWAVYPNLGAMYPITGSVPYLRAQVPHPWAVNPVLEARNPSQGRDLSNRLQMPLPGRHGTGDTSPQWPQLLSSRPYPSSWQGVDNHSFLCSPAGPMLLAEMTVIVIIVICTEGVRPGIGMSCTPGEL